MRPEGTVVTCTGIIGPKVGQFSQIGGSVRRVKRASSGRQAAAKCRSPRSTQARGSWRRRGSRLRMIFFAHGCFRPRPIGEPRPGDARDDRRSRTRQGQPHAGGSGGDIRERDPRAAMSCGPAKQGSPARNGLKRVFGTSIVSGTFTRPHDAARQSVIANKERQRCRSGTHHDSTPLHS
jgi:hypothetical protein